MKIADNIQTIFWDFDGVLLNSNELREQGFTEVLKDYPNKEVDQLLEFHLQNGGLSRYVKFRYFFEEIRGEKNVTEEKISEYAARFSEIMKNLLVNPELLIVETLEFVRNKQYTFNMHIVSGSDQKELRYLCDELKITRYFETINGSPKPKTNWVAELIRKYNYNAKECLLIGDSINDYEAAVDNKITFVGYGNTEILKQSELHWEQLKAI